VPPACGRFRAGLLIEKRPAGPWLQVRPGNCAYGIGEAVAAALPAGETTGEACAGAVAGDDAGDDCAFPGAGEVCVGWSFISSRRKALLATLWCEYRTDSANVSAKNVPASHVVNFTSTFVVCAPKMFSVTPAPKAAPRPSLFGRCIRMTRIIRLATSTKSTRQKLISRLIGEAKYGQSIGRSKRRTSNVKAQSRSATRARRLLDFVPNRIQLMQFHFAQFPAAPFEFVL
jgi:hypothetical protein